MTVLRAALCLAALLLALPALAGTVTVTSEDGVRLEGREYGSGSAGVVLVHGESRSAEDWIWLAERLALQGHRVVALDLRGHGQSDGTAPDDDALPLVADVTAAIAHLGRRGATEITLVGANLGANLALHAAAAAPEVQSVVLVSPGMTLQGVALRPALSDYGDRPLLVLASEEDTYAARSARFAMSLAEGPKQLHLAATGSGTRMVNRDIDLQTALTAWIGGSWQHLDPPPRRGVQTEARPDLETSGRKFGER